MTFAQLKQKLCCLTDRVVILEAGGGTGYELEIITSPDVSTFDDSRGAVGAISYNLTLGNKYEKISVSPHTWIALALATS